MSLESQRELLLTSEILDDLWRPIIADISDTRKAKLLDTGKFPQQTPDELLRISLQAISRYDVRGQKREIGVWGCRDGCDASFELMETGGGLSFAVYRKSTCEKGLSMVQVWALENPRLFPSLVKDLTPEIGPAPKMTSAPEMNPYPKPRLVISR